MSHVLEFQIEGLAGRGDVTAIKLNRDLNIFFGFNGSGKTSLLKILHSAMLADASLLRSVPFRAAEVKIYSKTYNCVIKRSIQKNEAPTQLEFPEASPPSETVPVVSSERMYLSFSQ